MKTQTPFYFKSIGLAFTVLILNILVAFSVHYISYNIFPGKTFIQVTLLLCDIGFFCFTCYFFEKILERLD